MARPPLLSRTVFGRIAGTSGANSPTSENERGQAVSALETPTAPISLKRFTRLFSLGETMHFVLIVAVLLATTLAEKAPAEAVDHTAARTLLALAAMLLAPALAATMSAVVIRGIRRDNGTWAEWVARFAFGQQVHAGLFVLLVGVIGYVLAWPQVVRVNLGLAEWILVDDLLILAPIYVPLLLSWAAFYDVDRAVYDLTADEGEPGASPQRWEYVLLHARHYLGLVLAPLLLVLAVYDTARWIAPEFVVGPYAWTLMAPLMLVLVAVLPHLIATMWKTAPLPPGELRSHLQNVLADCRLRVRELMLWQTGGRITNAAVSGIVPGMRYVFLTDRLVETLEADEIAAVLRHEAGHVVRHHLLLRMLCLGMPLAVWLSAAQATPQALAALSQALIGLGISEHVQETLLVPGLIAAYALIGLGGFCKLLEYEADLFACGLLGRCDKNQGDQQSRSFIAALAKITAASGQDRSRSGWLHPSIARRMRMIRAARRDPLLAARFQRRIKFLTAAIFLTYLVSLALPLLLRAL